MKILDEILNRQPSHIIYHYTTHDGLIGILSSKSIWSTHIRYLNDSYEFVYGLELLKNQINQYYTIKDKRNGYANSLLNRLEGSEYSHTFITSFSENGDLLSQWRGYTDNAAGYSIGFENNYLKPLIREQKFKLVPCIYNEHEQTEIVNEFITDLIDTCAKNDSDNSPPQETSQLIIRYAFKFVESIAPLLKHPSFSEEREWRLVSPLFFSDSNNKFLYRSVKSMITPYMTFNIVKGKGKVKIADLIIGPTPHADLSLFSVRSLLLSKKIDCSLFSNSNIPYRGW